ncbi:MAG TPA: hypothetical protein PLP17_13115 [Oligoflexia bacterium]|nr:hypothetical protein [Oligoflexia bacterium]
MPTSFQSLPQNIQNQWNQGVQQAQQEQEGKGSGEEEQQQGKGSACVPTNKPDP